MRLRLVYCFKKSKIDKEHGPQQYLKKVFQTKVASRSSNKIVSTIKSLNITHTTTHSVNPKKSSTEIIAMNIHCHCGHCLFFPYLNPRPRRNNFNLPEVFNIWTRHVLQITLDNVIPLRFSSVNATQTFHIAQSDLDDNPGRCTICITGFQLQQQVRRLSCGHIFHTACIMEWLRLHDKCPNCNSQLGLPITETQSRVMLELVAEHAIIGHRITRVSSLLRNQPDMLVIELRTIVTRLCEQQRRMIEVHNYRQRRIDFEHFRRSGFVEQHANMLSLYRPFQPILRFANIIPRPQHNVRRPMATWADRLREETESGNERSMQVFGELLVDPNEALVDPRQDLVEDDDDEVMPVPQPPVAQNPAADNASLELIGPSYPTLSDNFHYDIFDNNNGNAGSPATTSSSSSITIFVRTSRRRRSRSVTNLVNRCRRRSRYVRRTQSFPPTLRRSVYDYEIENIITSNPIAPLAINLLSDEPTNRNTIDDENMEPSTSHGRVRAGMKRSLLVKSQSSSKSSSDDAYYEGPSTSHGIRDLETRTKQLKTTCETTPADSASDNATTGRRRRRSNSDEDNLAECSSSRRSESSPPAKRSTNESIGSSDSPASGVFTIPDDSIRDSLLDYNLSETSTMSSYRSSPGPDAASKKVVSQQSALAAVQQGQAVAVDDDQPGPSSSFYSQLRLRPVVPPEDSLTDSAVDDASPMSSLSAYRNSPVGDVVEAANSVRSSDSSVGSALVEFIGNNGIPPEPMDAPMPVPRPPAPGPSIMRPLNEAAVRRQFLREAVGPLSSDSSSSIDDPSPSR